MRVRALALVVGLSLVALSASACTSLTSVFQPKPKVVTQEGTVASPDAKVNGELPQDLPEGLPLWPGAEVDTAAIDEGGVVTLTLTTSDTFDDVVAGMGAGFERAGWDVVQGLADDTSTVLEVTDEQHAGVVTITAGDDVGTAIAYVLTPAE